MFSENHGSGDLAAARPGVEAELDRDSEPSMPLLISSVDLVTEDFDRGLVLKLSPQRLESVLSCSAFQLTLRQRLDYFILFV